MVIDFNTTVGQSMDAYFDPLELLKEMDDNQVDMAVIAPPDKYLAVFNQEGNDYIAGCMQLYPDRFIGFGCSNPWFEEGAVEEVYRVKKIGLKGLKMSPFVQGYMLSDKMMDPVLRACAVTHLPVLVNTGTPVSSMPFQLRELAIRFPEVEFIMGHMGFSDFWYDVNDAAKGLNNLYLEYSYQMPSVITGAIKACGAKRVLFGSDWPFSREKLEIVKAGLAETEADKKQILGGNACRLLRLAEDKYDY